MYEKPYTCHVMPALPAPEWVRIEYHTQERNAQDASLLLSQDFLRHGPLHDKTIALADVKMWVINHLQSCTSQSARTTRTCENVVTLIHAYWSSSSVIYEGNPNELSSALLVVLSLWTSLDMLCCDCLPLLVEYAPELPVKLLETLLLPRLKHIESLQKFELYLQQRNLRVSLYLSNTTLRTGGRNLSPPDISASLLACKHFGLLSSKSQNGSDC